jgi:hypothetical protein
MKPQRCCTWDPVKFHDLLSFSFFPYKTLSLWPFRAVFRAASFAVGNAQCIFGAPDNMIPYAGKVFYTAAPDQNYRVFLQIMPDSGDIGGNFGTMGKAYTGNLAKGRIWFFWRYSHYTGTNTAFLGAGL